MATSSGWDKTTPLGTDAVSSGDDDIRSFKSYMQAWWEDEHYGTDGSASSAGQHKLGSARIYQQSSAPAFEDAGRLWHDTDDNTLYVSVSGSWTQVSSDVQTGSVNTWSALQNFSSGMSGSGLTVSGDARIDGTISTVSTSNLKIGDGATITKVLTGSLTTNMPSVPAGSFHQFYVDVPGAAVGDYALVSFEDIGSMLATYYIDSANSVFVNLHNESVGALDPPSQTVRAIVIKAT